MRIRNERPADADAIHALVAAAFRDAPHTSHTEHFIVAALRNAGQLAVSLVAEEDDGIVGYVAASPVSISDGTQAWYGLGPVAVSPARQAQGIGRRLVEQALQALRGLGAAGCVVLGEPAYYGRFGFRAEPALGLPGVPPGYFQALSFGGALPCGSVSYHEAFDAQD